MVAVLKQASNNTGLALARELSPGVVDGTAVWNTQEPNSYKDFGGSYKMIARNPINSSRQNKKGVITDLDASGGWQEDITYTGIQDKMEGLFFADYRRKSETAVTGTDTTADTINVASSTGFAAGDIVFVSGATVAANNGAKHVSAVASGTISVSENLVTEVFTGKVAKVGKQAASGDLTYTAATKTLASTALDFTTLGLIVGEWLYLSDDVAGNNLGANLGMARIYTIAAHAIVFDKVSPADPATAIVDAAGSGKAARIYFGRVIKNELEAGIKHYTFQAERTLGKDDSTAADVQSEYITGCVINDGTFVFNTADKGTCDWTLLGAKYETRTSAVGKKAGTRPANVEGSVYNTSTDIRRMSLELAGQDVPLYAYLMDMSIMVKNNAKANKALGVLGSIGITEGQFEVSATATAYFANVTAAQAIENNSDVTLDAFLSRDNQGIVFDLPLVSLGDGRPKITANEVIQLPLSIDAATAASLNPAADYTMMVVFFDYLPNIAM